MPLENTGMIVGHRNSAIIIAPVSAFVIEAQCQRGCGKVYYVAGKTWCEDVDCATIFRTFEAAELGKIDAQANAMGCLKDQGVSFDAKPLAGYVGR